MNEIKINWFTKLMFKFWPSLAMVRMARKMGIADPLFDEAQELFSRVRRIDVLPSASGLRGFVVVLDRKTALYFCQNGDHFVYDGFEMGRYDKGDITIFDNTKRNV
ncbi:MAG: hypothetical protein Q7J30_01095 [Candidatus Azambacteria bacterium]|nr:hypothetical protein [Candidatus Azambacteria bacterium]